MRVGCSWPPGGIVVVLAAAAAGASSSSRGSQPSPPCPVRTRPKICVLGGDDAGTAAAWAAAKLEASTRSPIRWANTKRTRAVAGVDFYHDGGFNVPSGGGLNMDLLNSDPMPGSNRSSNINVAGGPGDAFLFFDTLLRTDPINKSLEIIDGWLAVPRSGTVSSDGAVQGLQLAHRNGSFCSLQCTYVIDGTPEGFAAAAFELPIVLGREKLDETVEDPTLRAEAYGGRRTFAVDGHGPPVEIWSDRGVEREDVSSGAGTITNLCQYGSGDSGPPPDAHWLLTRPPMGYDPSLFTAPAHGHFVDGWCCRSGPGGCNPQVFRYQGLSLSVPFANHTGSTGPTLPRWYECNRPGRPHYLRAAYSDPTSVWKLKREVEAAALFWAVGGLYFIQNNITNGRWWGFCQSTFPQVNPKVEMKSIPPGPYTLADFNTSTYGGDVSVAVRLYVRQVARLASTRPVGAALLYDGAPRLKTPDVTPAFPKPRTVTKKNWEPEAVVFPLYGTDFTKGVLGNTVPLPRPFKNQYYASGDGVLFGNDPDKGNFHGIHRRILFPDERASAAEISSGDRPPAGNFSRTFVTNFLSPGAPRTTFMMQSSARIGCFASNIGAAAGVFAALAERFGYHNTSAVPTMLVQWTLGLNLSSAITYYNPPLSMTGPLFAALQISGAYAVPPDIDARDPQTDVVTLSALSQMLASYASGILNGTVVATPSGPPSSDDYCLTNSSWFAFSQDWNFDADTNQLIARQKPSFNCAAGALLKRCTGKSTFLPARDVQCFPPGTSVSIRSRPRPSANPGLLVVEPKFAKATRAALWSGLENISADTAGRAMAPQKGVSAAQAITLADLAHVVARHAAVMREKQFKEPIMTLLGLKPYTFKS